MISDKFALDQLARMGRLHYFPKNNETELKELKRALMVAGTEQIAKQAITEIVDTMDDCPTPRMIRELCYDANFKADSRARTRRENCRVCGGTGWKIVERGGRSGARECICRKRAVGV